MNIATFFLTTLWQLLSNQHFSNHGLFAAVSSVYHFFSLLAPNCYQYQISPHLVNTLFSIRKMRILQVITKGKFSI